jgi:7 transmembrane receptor (rhodopsin family).
MEDVFIYLLVVSIGLIYTIFNILTLTVIISSRKLRKRTSTMPTISFLVASALQGMLPAPLYIYRKLEHKDEYPAWACDLYRFPYLFCGHIMQMSVLLVSFDRMVAIKYPFRYENNSGKRKMVIALIVLWAITLTVDIIPFLHGMGIHDGCLFQPARFWGLSVIAFYNIIPFVLIVTNYVIIWSVAAKFAVSDKKRVNTVRSNASLFEENESKISVSKPLVTQKNSYGALQSNVNKRLSNIRFYLEIKATKTSLVLVLVYLLCWGPLSVFYIMDHFCNGCYSKDSETAIVRMVIKLVNFSSSLMVPLFYCWWNADYRSTAMNVFRRCIYCRNSEDSFHSKDELNSTYNGHTRTTVTTTETRFD